MLYFEFNRSGGTDKYIPMTEEAFRQAAVHGSRYFVMYEESNNKGYVRDILPRLKRRGLPPSPTGLVLAR